MPAKYVYAFGGGSAEGDGTQKNLLGGKGAGLAEMSRLGIPVPPGFTITTEVCTFYQEHDGGYPEDLEREVAEHLGRLEEQTGQRFGDAGNPLLVSVRSGAARSMPGMMDTILNLGLSEEVVAAWIGRGEDARFVLDAYRRLLTMYGDVVMEVPHADFERILGAAREAQGAANDAELTAESLRGVADAFKALIEERCGKPFPQEPHEQLWGAIGAVFASWNNPRAREYRKIEGISGLLGHGRQRAEHGLRQPRQRLRDRRRLHPQPGDRRAAGLRRVPDQRPGRGRGGRHPDAEADRRGDGRDGLAEDFPEASRRAPRGLRDAGAPLPRHAGRRVHHPARQAVHAADARGQAHRPGRRAHRRRDGGRGADRSTRGARPRRARAARRSSWPRSSTPRRRRRRSPAARCWLTACPPARAPPPGGSP